MAVDWLASRWLSEEAFSGQDVNEAVLAQVKAVSAWLEPLGADSDHAWYTWAAQVRKALQSRMARAVSATETVKTASMAPAGVPPDSHAAAVSDPEASADIPAPAVTSPVPPIVSAPASAGIHSAETLVKAHRSGQSFIESLCDYLRHKSLLDANAYLMARTYAFSGVVSLPPSREGVTELRPVPDEKRHKLEALAAAGEWAACIHELERSLFRLPFWLTGHRMVAEALEKLGGSGVAQLIQALCHAWVERFPALTDYRFKGGEVHFADARTRQWLSRTGVSTRVEAAPQSPVPQQRGGQADKAHELPDVSALDTPDALRTLAQAAAGEPEPRRQLDIWLAQGELARERGETPLASAIGRGVLAQLDRQPAGYFLRTEKMKALALAAGAPLEIRPELSELSLCQPHIAQQLINHM
ncbi:type VI secretion system domain-containing protein [Hahella sp. SMD15-11]|uniref:Type VI secretion system domain-containing protein n=1 Tax=Thermohahella caldifontis TaxID=3142973 RepID=A0AB39UZ41_9GAMM